MISNQLPKQIHPLQLALHNAVLKGSINIAELIRLADLLWDDKGVIEVDLHFGRDEEHFYFIKGTLQGHLHLTCQRCLQAMDYPIQVTIGLSPAANEEAARSIPAKYEPLILEEDVVSLASIIEEELLLNLPLVAKHPPKECAIKLQKSSENEDNEPTKKPNPFQVLERLKSKKPE